MVDVVLHLVVNQLSEDIFVLPSPLCVLFKSLEENCASRGVKTPHNCAGIKVCMSRIKENLIVWLTYDHFTFHVSIKLHPFDTKIRLPSAPVYCSDTSVSFYKGPRKLEISKMVQYQANF